MIPAPTRRYADSILAFIAALLLGLSFPPIGAWYLSPVAMLCLFWALDPGHEKKGLWWRVGIPFALTVQLWVWFWLRTVTVYVGPAYAQVAWLGAALIQSFFWVLAFFVYTRWPLKYPWRFFYFALVFVMGDVLRAQGPWAATYGAPWLPLIDFSFFALNARYLGYWGFGLLYMNLCGAGYALLRALYERRYVPVIFGFNAFLAVIFCLCLYGRLVFPTLLIIPPDHPLQHKRVALLQGNFAQSLKLSANSFQAMQDFYLSATRALPRDVDVALWPETVIPAFMLDRPSFVYGLRSALEGRETEVVLGLPLRGPGESYFNGAVLFSNEGPVASYTKSRLVPFGEYIPLRSVLRKLIGDQAYMQTDYAVGTVRYPLQTRAGKAGILICFESTLPQLARQRKHDGADWLAVLTNDAWFLDSPAAAMHLQISRWRAVEQGLPLFFAANTGISAVVDPAGRVLQSLALGKQGQIVYYFERAYRPVM